MKLLDELASRQRFGIKPGLDAMRGICAALGDPQKSVRAIHVAGTNGKGAVCAILDACIRAAGLRAGRYTSPHLVRLNERFFLDGAPIDDSALDRAVASLLDSRTTNHEPRTTLPDSLTYFELLTVVAFLVYAEAKPDYVVLETGLGGRLDATNVCSPALTIITRIGLDHCDWLGDTVEKIAAEKAGIIKPGVPVVLGRNVPEVVAVVKARAAEVGAPFVYAPDVADESEIPADFSLAGSFNRENAVTALAALKLIFPTPRSPFPVPRSPFPVPRSPFPGPRSPLPAPRSPLPGFSRVVWPGRFQRVGDFIVDGAHNPPAARALASALGELPGVAPRSLTLVAGFCGDKDVEETLRIIAPFVRSAIAVKTNNPRSLEAEELRKKMESVGIPAISAPTLSSALATQLPNSRSPRTTNHEPRTTNHEPRTTNHEPRTLICGSLFLAGEALVELNAYPWPSARFDPSESVKSTQR